MLADDLLPDSVLSYHDKQLDAYVIQWTNVMFPNSPIPLGTFQAFLFQNGSIGYVYRDLFGFDQGLGSSAVIGKHQRQELVEPESMQDKHMAADSYNHAFT